MDCSPIQARARDTSIFLSEVMVIPPSFRAAIIVCVNVRADALKKINSAEKRGNRQVPIRLCSKVMDRLLTVMMKDGHFGEFDITEDHRAGKAVSFTGRLNKCGAVSLGFDAHLEGLGKRQNNLLPPGQLGFTVLTTSAGIKDHEEARRKHTGGNKSLDSFSRDVIHTHKMPQRGAWKPRHL